MQIAVAHHTLNIPGGAERLCLAVVEALRNHGHDVTLITVEKTDWDKIQKNFGKILRPNKEEYMTESRLSNDLSTIPVASMYFMIYIMQLLTCKAKKKYDLTINTFGDVINSIADVTYVHFPLRAALELSQVPAFSNKSMWQAIAPFYGLAMSFVDKIAPGTLITNSKFMQGVIRTVLHRNSLVVYPPVDVEKFSLKCFRERKNDHIVAVVASYTPKRHLERVPLIARYTKHARFIVMGKADEYSAPILENLKHQIAALNVDDRVKLLTNVPFAEFAKTFSQAKVYLHIMPKDHFGISVVEAMASGCVPVVHRSGGPWLDILDTRQGEYGYSYLTAAEAARYIDMLVTNEDLRSEMSIKALDRAKKFEKTVFMEKIVKVVEKIAG